MHAHMRRWLGLIVVPTFVAYALLLALAGSPERALVQIVALPLFYAGALRRRETLGAGAFVWGAVHYFVVMAVSGGIASPMLPLGLPLASAAAVVVADKGAKIRLALGFAVGFAVLAIISAQPWGAPPAPFVTANGTLSTTYFVALGCASSFAVMSALRMGMKVTAAYARVAEELAARREELCDEGSNHSRMLEGVAARLAHEMNNPLAAIKALSAHVARSCADEKTAERVAVVATEAERLRVIVDGFLTFSRSLDDLRVATLRPYELARELATILGSRLSDRAQSLEVIGDEKLELRADARKLRQALHNLVQNAMDASPRGAKITIAVVLTKDDLVRVRVVDQGEGMTPEVLERIAKPYFSTRQGGSGLGIALARVIVAQHGGVLRFESEASRGTTATIDVPHNAVLPPCEALPRPEVDVTACGRKKQAKSAT